MMSSTGLSQKQKELLKGLVEASQGEALEFFIVETHTTDPTAIFPNNKRYSPANRGDLAELRDAGYVRETTVNSQGNTVYAVTNRGFQVVQDDFEEEVQSAPAGGGDVITNIIQGDVIGSNIGSPGATVNWNDVLPEVTNLVQELRKAFDNEPPPNAGEALADIETLEAQLKSDKPKAGIVRECLVSLRTVTESVAASAVWASLQVKIVELLPKLQALLPGA